MDKTQLRRITKCLESANNKLKESRKSFDEAVNIVRKLELQFRNMRDEVER